METLLGLNDANEVDGKDGKDGIFHRKMLGKCWDSGLFGCLFLGKTGDPVVWILKGSTCDRCLWSLRLAMFQMLQGGPEGETKDVPYKMKFPQDDKVKTWQMSSSASLMDMICK